MGNLTHMALEYPILEGAIKSGIATVDTLAGGPPSVDLSYVMPEAKSAIVFSVAIDQDPIPGYLGKKDRLSYEREYNKVNSISSGIAVKLAGNLSQRGYPAVPLAANDVYRADTPQGRFDMYPPVSLRYLAVASGVASFGWSGNVIDEEKGACIILGAVVTSAELMPTKPLNQENSYCDQCRMCMKVCASGLMDPKETTEVSLGDRTFSYAARRTYMRCQYVCGGYTGLHQSGKWSTWSPGRFPIPDEDEAFMPLLMASSTLYGRRPEGKGGRYHSMMDVKLYTTCGNCQIVCVPDKEERKRRYKLLAEGGVIVENADGTLEALAPQKVEKRLSAMPADKRALYDGDLKDVEIAPTMPELARLAREK
ncbi:MAG: epoxyqueuosine reductase [Deltaproteobacteria bacterium]|nr:epoxyqueuosine reductase [Deltaproteobacteria bacterium]